VVLRENNPKIKRQNQILKSKHFMLDLNTEAFGMAFCPFPNLVGMGFRIYSAVGFEAHAG